MFEKDSPIQSASQSGSECSGYKSDIGKNISELNVPEDVTLVAVSKKKPVSMIESAYHAGQRIFGESYVQEAIEKITFFRDKGGFEDMKWHFIGHLQSGKAKIAAKYFDMIQSIDSQKLARKLDSACGDVGKTMPVLIQINIGDEEQKSGVKIGQVESLLELVMDCPSLKLKGLMCIPPFDTDPRPYFRKMEKLYELYKEKFGLSILSMGMSRDYSVAIEEGSNMVRIGSRIFGMR